MRIVPVVLMLTEIEMAPRSRSVGLLQSGL
jgi:hypothetical protein